MNIWEEHAKRASRRAKLQRFDDRLKDLHENRPFLFHLIAVALGTFFAGAAIGISMLLDWLG